MNGIRILGLDPSLVACGWGMIEVEGTRLRHVAHGVIRPDPKAPLPLRLRELFQEISSVIEIYQPHEAAVEDAFMNKSAGSALKLGQARAACVLAASLPGLNVGEYAPLQVKKSVVGTGKADKFQVAHMMNVLMPGCGVKAGDASDALAIAVCHGHRVNAAGSGYRRSA